MDLSDPRHPIWPLARIVVIMAGTAGILAVTASSFDATELRAIGGSGLVALVAQFVKPLGKGDV
jgi:hypothetical protein